MENEKLYIRVNKGLCRQVPSKYEGRPNYNIMKLPKGTVVGDTDLSYAVINPIIMIEDTRNPNMFCAIYDKSRLTNNSIRVYMTVEGEKKYMPVDADCLRDAVAAANKAYYEEHKKDRSEQVEKQEDRQEAVTKEKLQPLTAKELKEAEEERDV